MPSPIKFSLFIFCFVFIKGHTQGVFNTGAKIGLGASVFPLHSTLVNDGVSIDAYTGTILSTGIITQYVIARRIGIESGFHINHYSYYYPDQQKVWKRRIWKGAAAIEMFDFQVPINIVHRFPVPSDPFRDITVLAGTSIDWLATDFLVKASRATWLKNIHGGIRLGKERMRGNRLEYGFEFQYSIDRFDLKGKNYNQLDMAISSRLSALTINLYYFFFDKDVGKVRE
jgi:hypothetical protein